MTFTQAIASVTSLSNTYNLRSTYTDHKKTDLVTARGLIENRMVHIEVNRKTRSITFTDLDTHDKKVKSY